MPAGMDWGGGASVHIAERCSNFRTINTPMYATGRFVGTYSDLCIAFVIFLIHLSIAFFLF